MNILAISPHSDDVEIGMGGTVSRLVAEGHEVLLLVVIVPCEYEDGKKDLEFKEKRWIEQEKSAGILGVELEVLDIDPYAFRFDRKHTKIIDKVVKDFSPKNIYSTWEHDTHQDHQSLASILSVATRKNTISHYMYETMIPGGINSYAFNPQKFVNISEHIGNKQKSIETYSSVFNDKMSHLVSGVLGRARYRGHQIGVEYAEAFEVVKDISL